MKTRKLEYPKNKDRKIIICTTRKKTHPIVITMLSLFLTMLLSWSIALGAIFTNSFVLYAKEVSAKDTSLFLPPFSQETPDESSDYDVNVQHPINQIVKYQGELPPVILNKIPTTVELTTEEVVEKVGPSVVGILSYQEQAGVLGNGSGIIISSDGFIITNAHVVSDSTRLEVVLQNDKMYKADIIGMDARTDLAVIKINAKNLQAAELGDSDDVKVGGRAIAIGNPGGLANTVTQGIISAKDRQLTVPVNENILASLTLLQTDASINPGNSGGALANKFGQIIGINSAKMQSSSYEGIGFAIPISIAKPIIEELMINGKIKDRAVLGVTVQPISRIITDPEDKLPSEGLLIVELADNCPLVDEDVQPGDVIVSVNGKNCSDTEALTATIKNLKPGDSITLKIFFAQSMEEKNVTVKLIED